MHFINQLRHHFFIARAKSKAWFTYYVLLTKDYRKSPKKKSSETTAIVHVNTFDNVGGAAKVAHDLCRYQQNKGLLSWMIVGKKKLNDDTVFQLPISETRKQHFLTTAQEELQWQDFFHLSSLDLIHHSTFKKADIVHLHNLHGNYFSPFAIPLLSSQKPTIWTLHDMQAITGHCAHSLDCKKWETGCGNCPHLDTYPKLTKDTTKFIHETKKKIYQTSNINIVVPSNWLKRKVEKSILSHLPVHTIYNGVDTAVYKKNDKAMVRNNLGIPNEKQVVLFSAELGVNNPFKGGEYVKSIVEKNSNNNVLFLNVGGGKEFEKRANVWTIPYISDSNEMAKYYSCADIYLYPTLADNCPLVVLEAMACGLPVVTFNTGGVPELVEHNKTGYVANYKDVDDLNKGLSMFLNNVTLRTEMGNNAIIKIREMFTLEIMNEHYLKLYRNILNSGH